MSKETVVGLDTVIAQVEGLVSSDVEGEVVMMSVESGMYYGLDSVGSRIWQLIKEPRSVSKVRDILVEEYDVEREVCERDVLDFVAEMHTEGIVRIVNRAAG
jgi:hypothetical protein